VNASSRIDEVLPAEQDESLEGAVAVVGMAGRFAGARDLEELWQRLRDGREGIARLADEQLLAAGTDPALLADPRYVKAQAAVADIELFDGACFGFTPRESEIASPALRLLLEASWHALDDAGRDPARFPGTIGVFVSASFNPYLLRLLSQPQLVRGMGGLRIHLANDPDFLATSISYKLGLKGPSVNVQTACSSSLVAIHLACQSLLNGECDLALAGGASVRNLGPAGYLYQEEGILSPDGHCRAFDAQAAGTVDGDGVGIVALRRLADARRDRDNLQAVVRGSAINNDGAAKIGFTAPGLEGQTRVISEALVVAGIDPATVGYVEAHGTGTRLGDPAEVAALTEAFRGKTSETGFCALGSIKTNLGHLGAAAGVAGLIKVVLSLKHRQLPPSLHFSRPNPEIDFATSPFYVNAALAPWRERAGCRRAGVSSFGIGGTNAHAVVEEAPEVEPGPARAWQLLIWSARTAGALDGTTAALAGALQRPGIALADAAFTLQTGRRQLAHRRALVCRDAVAAAAVLARAGGWLRTSRGEAGPGPVAFLFPGQGAQRPGMTRELYAAEPRFRAELDRCAQLLAPHCGGDVREVLHAVPPDGRLDQTAWTQPALFAVEYALARLWMSWGVQPRALLGHGIGEYVAACLAGVLELEDALGLVAWRPQAVEPILPAFAERVGRVRLRPPRIPLVSSLTGDWLGEGQAADPGYWVRHLREPVRFGAGVERLLTADGWRLLEVGPGETLAGLVQRSSALRPEAHVIVSSLARLPGAESEVASLLDALGRMWVAGVEIDWRSVSSGERRRRISLPGYPFEHLRHWVEAGRREPHSEAAPREADGAGTAAAARMTASEAAAPVIAAAAPAAGGSAPARPPLAPIPRGAAVPLSFAQERLWFLHQLAPASAAYNLPFLLPLPADVDAPALAAALREVVRRHESLRTVFPAQLGEPAQAVQPAGPWPLPEIDLAGLPSAARAREGRRLAAGQARRGFDLARGPLLRTLLLRLGGGGAALFGNVHHVVADGWSMRILAREVAALYEAARQHRPSPLAEPRLQYADFTLWQRSWLHGEELARQLEFWRGVLAGVPQVLELPTDRPRPAEQSFRGAARSRRLPPELAAQLRARGRQLGATPFMVMLGAFAALLARLARQDQLLIGTPIANRHHAELEELVGCFVNSLVLRVDLDGVPTLGELVQQARRRVLEASAHQDLPFERLADELGVARRRDRSPLYQVELVVEEARPERAPARPEAGIAGIQPLTAGGAKFDWTLTVEEGDAGVWLGAEYAADLFDGATVARWLRQLELVLAVAAAAPERRVDELPLLAAAERHQLLHEWGAGGLPAAGAESCLHQLFEAQAAATPAAVAVVAGGEALTYAELDRWAAWIAAALRRAGARTDVPVGLCCERSLEMVAGMLGILKAGAAYLPLDPGHPAARLALLLGDAGAPLLLAGAVPAAPAAAAVAGIAVLPIGERPVDGGGEGARNGGGAQLGAARAARSAVPAAIPESLAYVIYTSGSTGWPKGVMVPHRAIVNRVLWMKAECPLGPADAVLQKTPAVFDASIWELFLPLVCGARLVMAAPGAHRDPGALTRAIVEQRVTVLQLVPSLLGAFLDAPGLAGCASLRRLYCGGESLSPALRDRVFATLPVQLHNLYGPTECAIDVTSWPCPRQDRRPCVPIGRPLSGIHLRLLGRDGQPVPIGAPGELHAGGIGLARGYLGQPAVTAERFVPDPLPEGGVAGGRLYRTGDLARYLPDGALEYLGRLDRQVKVRGVRIEPAEIEAALAEHPAVGEAAVGVVDGRGDGGRLVAWIAGRAAAALPDAAALRRFLAGRLPGAMVPGSFVPVAALPRTASGKVDRRALAALPAAVAADPAAAGPVSGKERRC
jgi:amino acid adenylation domain-containing protein